MFVAPSRSSGKERDSETGLDYFGARYYGSAMGRWLSPDWAAAPVPVPYAELGDPQSLNLYGYVRNNPLAKADLDGHCADGQDCRDLKPNPLNQVTPAEKQAINQSVRDSNTKNATDRTGGSHEEGGVSYTQDGNKVVAPAQPGAFKDVKQPGVAEIDPYKAANPAQQKPGDVQADVVWHVHPSAQVTETTGPAAPGTVVIGGTTRTTTYNFNQPPSPVDIGAASPTPTLNLVIGARSNTVYVFNSSGTQCTESLKNFNKEPNQ